MFGFNLTMDSTHLIEMLRDWVKDVKVESRVKLVLKGMVLSEMLWNRFVIEEYIKITQKNTKLDTQVCILNELSFINIEKIQAATFPVSHLFPETYVCKPFKNKTYSHYTRDINTHDELIYKTYHHLRVLQLRDKLDIEISRLSLNYSLFLCYQTVHAVRSKKR